MTDVLLYVEDPGAANFAGPLPKALAETGREAVLVADGDAVPYLDGQDVDFDILEDGVEAALDRHDPALVASGTSMNLDSPGLDLVEAARDVGLPTLGLVDAYRGAGRRFRGRTDDPLAHVPDWICVPDAATARAFEELGFPADRLMVSGHPRYDEVRRTRMRLERTGREALRTSAVPGDPGDDPVVTFLAEPAPTDGPWKLARTPRYTLSGRGDRDDRTSIVLEELLDALDASNAGCHLVLRLHPRNTGDDLAGLDDEVDATSRGPGLHELLFASDLVVGMTSMAMVEAALLGRPTLSVLPRPSERAWLPTIRSHATPCTTTRDELKKTLPRLLQGEADPPPFDPPQGAAGRVAELVDKLLEGAT